ncbi:DUF4352 domain-containing protein [Gordonia alkaliphila]|uniref:DUF4352 domain-containing protein n=1 Tax=Gordonia alkaliphila TaxID=1053547 RepID=A0ABP8Z0B7_9ACTN
MTNPTPPPAEQPDGTPQQPVPPQQPGTPQDQESGQYQPGQFQSSGQFQTPGQFQSSGQFQVPPTYPAFGTPPPPPAPKSRNTIGIIALVAALVGFLFACIPGALIIGWILLPIAFILGIVGLFNSQPKGTAIAAVIISIVGTIVGVVVFLTVVTDAVDDALNSDDTVSLVDPNGETTDQGEDSGAVGSKENPAPLGSTLKAGDWEVTLNSFDPNATQKVLAANSFNDEPAAGNEYALANLTAKYVGEGSKSTFDLTVAYVTSAGNVINSYDNNAVGPDPTFDGEVYNGASVTGNVDFEIADGDKGLIRVDMGIFGKEVYFATR